MGLSADISHRDFTPDPCHLRPSSCDSRKKISLIAAIAKSQQHAAENMFRCRMKYGYVSFVDVTCLR